MSDGYEACFVDYFFVFFLKSLELMNSEIWIWWYRDYELKEWWSGGGEVHVFANGRH